MTQRIASHLIPLVNIYEEIRASRGRDFNEEVDISFPPYIIDKRILKCLEQKNLGYLKSYLKSCPRNIERYFFLERVASVKPVLRSIIISNLLGYALLYRASNCLQYLLGSGSNPFQPAYFIEWISGGANDKKLLLYEAPSIILLSGCIKEETKQDAIDLLYSLREAEIELHLPVGLRRQQLEPPNEPISVNIRFADSWECLEKEVEKKTNESIAKNKAILKELKAVYRANKFDKIDPSKKS